MIRYESTRGQAAELSFADVLLAGLATDGGLYVPDTVPPAPTDLSADLAYADFAAEVIGPFVEGSIDRDVLHELTRAAYATFDHDDVVPLRALDGFADDRIELVELFHGPTLAFKDVAMQLLGRMFEHELARRERHVTIVGATSGDTGSAAIEAFRDRANVDIVILHPAGRTSEVQRRQMTTVDAANVTNIAIEGTFDDCQDLVKAMFADAEFRDRIGLAAVNSINWARVAAQIVYYHWAASRHRHRPDPATVVVPTGNFGNVFAGHLATTMGAPIERLVVASNRNAILTQFFTEAAMTITPVEPSLSPSMDIVVSSNLERLIHELLGRDGAAVAELMAEFRSSGSVAFGSDVRSQLAERWAGYRTDDDETLDTIRRVYESAGVLLDPHTAVGVHAAARHGGPCVVMATAHPAKFPDAVEQATGERPALPDRLADLFDRPEHVTTLPNDYVAVTEYIAGG